MCTASVNKYEKEWLGERLWVAVSPEHTFGTDAFLLSHFAAPRPRDRVCDLGTGCGIVALLWYRQQELGPREAVCVDIQPQAIRQLGQTVAGNGLAGQVFPHLGDLREQSQLPPAGQFDLVTCNPPYKAAGRGILSQGDSDRLARHETACDTADVCKAAGRLLRFGGRFCLCQRPERLPDLLLAMRDQGLEPKRLRFVQHRADTAPWLFLVEGRRGGKPFLQVEPPLILERADGSPTPEVLAIYQKLQPGNPANHNERRA